jgi:hypothetical protein
MCHDIFSQNLRELINTVTVQDKYGFSKSMSVVFFFF